MESLSFDRAADYYDRTRSLSPGAMDRITSLLAAELTGRSTCLEVGIGTGRIGLPLQERGIDLAGVDLSMNMLTVLRDKATTQVPLAVADATMLPFADDSFGAALACHVLHLIPEWRRAALEMARVVRAGGLVLIDLGGWSGGAWEALEKRFVGVAGIDNPRPGATDPAELDAVMASVGARLRMLTEIADTRSLPYGEVIDRMADGLYSFTWSVDDATRRRAADAVRAWAQTELGDLDTVREQRWVVKWRAYDLP